MNRSPARRRPVPALAPAGLACAALLALAAGCQPHAQSDTSSAPRPQPPAAPAAAPATMPAAPSAQGPTVQIKGFKFQPATLEVKAGTAVTWRNDDGLDHTVTSGTTDAPQDGPLKGKVNGSGGTWSYTFDKPGEYVYHCDFHPKMAGRVVVN